MVGIFTNGVIATLWLTATVKDITGDEESVKVSVGICRAGDTGLRIMFLLIAIPSINPAKRT